jgi:hypothetical protein
VTALRVVSAYACKCERCGHEWTAAEVPERCAKCKRLYWNAKPGELKRGRPAGKKKPRKVKS